MNKQITMNNDYKCVCEYSFRIDDIFSIPEHIK